MAELIVVASAETSTEVTRAMTKESWNQQHGENDLWYARFLRFIALGPSRSVSLVSMGRRNAYPVPAHWPMIAKQHNWRERAKAFDEAAKADAKVIVAFNNLLAAAAGSAKNGEAEPLQAAAASGGYQIPLDEEADDFGLSETR